jgi:sugar lactone lactonase YvrE
MDKMKKIAVLLIFIISSCSSHKIGVKKEISKISTKKETKITVFSGGNTQNDVFLNYPSSVLKLDDGLQLIADTRNNRIRQIKDNQILNFAGNGKDENIDGKYQAASFQNPESIIIDSKKNIYVSVNYHQIRKIDSLGNVSMFAGKRYRGTIDGPADGEVESPKETAYFPLISSLRIDKNDVFYVAGGHLIRKIATDGLVTTIAGHNEPGDKIGNTKNALFYQISDIALNDEGDIFVVDQVNKKIKLIKKERIVSEFIPRGVIDWPTAIAINSKKEVIVFDSSKKRLYKFDEKGKLLNVFSHEKLFNEKFAFQVKITVDEKDNIIIPSENYIITITPNNEVTQIGGKDGTHRNGDVNNATYQMPFDGVFDKSGNLFVVDKGNNLIRKISKNGVVSTFTGSGIYGSRDGKNTICEFEYPNAITIGNNGKLFVLDGDWKETRIRVIDLEGNTTTFLDSKRSTINWERPADLVCDSNNNLLISDSVKNTIYKVTPTGISSNYFESKDLKLNSPQGIAIDKKDNLFICDSYNNRIVKISKNKSISLITPNNGIFFDEPENVAIDDLGNMFVTDKNRTRIIKISNSNESEIYLKEDTLGKNKDRNLSEYCNTLKIEIFNNEVYVFDKYDNQIIKLN